MKKLFILLAVVLILTVGLIFLKGKDSNSSEKTRVLVSILPQKEFVKEVGKDKIEVRELIHPGESPATYNLTAKDLEEISQADIYFRIGHIPFEKANIEKIRETNPDLKIIDISEETHILYFLESEEHSHPSTSSGQVQGEEEEDHEEEHSEEATDPHLWLSIKNAKILTDQIATELSRLDPDNKDFYTNNAKEYKNNLEETSSNLTERLRKVDNKKLLVFHPAWGYFADEFGFTQIAIEQEGKEPTAEGISEIINLINEENIPVIFVQEQFSTNQSESIANETNIKVLKIDPLAENYLENLEEIATIFETEL